MKNSGNNLTWILPVLLLSVLIIFSIGASIYKNKNKNVKAINIQKMAFVAIFSALVFVSGFFTFTIPPGVSLGFEEVSLILAGFILGPINGVIVALIGDSLAQGLLLGAFAKRHISYFLVAPIAALLGSLLRKAYDYFKYNKINERASVYTFNGVTIILFLSMLFLVLFGVKGVEENGVYPSYSLFEKIFYPLMAIIFILISQFLFFRVRKQENSNLVLFSLVCLIVLSEKIIGSWMLGTINSNQIYGVPTEIAFASKVVSTPIVVPFTSVILYHAITKIQFPTGLSINNHSTKW